MPRTREWLGGNQTSCKHNLSRPHRTATAMDGWDSAAMVTELKTQAMAKGADGLVIMDVHTETVGSYTSTYGDSADDKKWVIGEDGKLKHHGSGSNSSTSVTTDTKEKVMAAELLKYQ